MKDAAPSLFLKWFDTHRQEKAQWTTAAAALNDQIQQLRHNKPCPGSSCSCHTINSTVKQLSQAAAAILQDPTPYLSENTAGSATGKEQQQRRLHAQIRVQQLLGLPDVLTSPADALVRQGHSSEAVGSLADAFNRFVAVPIYAQLSSGPRLFNSLDASDVAGDVYKAAALAAGKHAFRKPMALLQSLLLAQLRKDPTNAWVDISTRLEKAVQAIPPNTVQLSATQAAKLSAWLARVVPEFTSAAQYTRPLFAWSAAVCRVEPTGSPLADRMVMTLLVRAAKAAAACMAAVSLLGRLESVGLQLPLLDGSSGSGSSCASTVQVGSSSHCGSTGTSCVATITAAAIDLLTVVSVEYAGYAELERHRSGERVASVCREQRQEVRQAGGKLDVTPYAAPPPLLTVRSSRQRDSSGGSFYLAERFGMATLLALGNTVLLFYASQLLKHFTQRQQQVAGEHQHASAARVPCPAPAAAVSSWAHAEGLLLLGADRLQGTAADQTQQLTAVAAAWHSELQEHLHILGHTQQQLDAAAAVVIDVSSAGSCGDSSSSGLVSVQECFRHLAAAAACLADTSALMATKAFDNMSVRGVAKYDTLLHAAVLLLFTASAALELLPPQQSIPLVSSYAWEAGNICGGVDAFVAYQISDILTPAQLMSMELAAKVQMESQRGPSWALFSSDDGHLKPELLCMQHRQATVSAAGMLAQQLLRLANAHVPAADKQQQQCHAAAAWTVYGCALHRSRLLLSESLDRFWELSSSCCLTPTPALLAQTAAVLQTSEAIIRLQAQAPAVEAGGGSFRACDDAGAGQPGWMLEFIDATLLATAALRFFCKAPRDLAQSVAGQQLLQAALSALLTAAKLQVAGKARELLPGDLAFCSVIACRALSAVTGPSPALTLSPHTEEGANASESPLGSSSNSIHSVSSIEGPHLILQLLGRCASILGHHLSAACAADADAAAHWLLKEHASPTVLDPGGQEESLQFGQPSSNLLGIHACFAAAKDSLKSTVGQRAGSSVTRSSKLDDSSSQPCGSNNAPASTAVANETGSSGSSRNIPINSSGHLVSSSKSSCHDPLPGLFIDELKRAHVSCMHLLVEVATLQNYLVQWHKDVAWWRSEQLPAEQHVEQQQEQTGHTQPAGSGEPVLPAKHATLIASLAASLLKLANDISALLPSHFCCSYMGCTSLATVSEGHALVRGQACICAGCKAARYCSRDCQAADWPKHRKVCATLAQQCAAVPPGFHSTTALSEHTAAETDATVRIGRLAGKPKATSSLAVSAAAVSFGSAASSSCCTISKCASASAAADAEAPTLGSSSAASTPAFSACDSCSAGSKSVAPAAISHAAGFGSGNSSGSGTASNGPPFKLACGSSNSSSKCARLAADAVDSKSAATGRSSRIPGQQFVRPAAESQSAAGASSSTASNSPKSAAAAKPAAPGSNSNTLGDSAKPGQAESQSAAGASRSPASKAAAAAPGSNSSEFAGPAAESQRVAGASSSPASKSANSAALRKLLAEKSHSRSKSNASGRSHSSPNSMPISKSDTCRVM